MLEEDTIEPDLRVEPVSARSYRWFDSIGLSVNREMQNGTTSIITQKQREHVYQFALENHPSELLQFLEDPFVQGIALLTVTLHPYLRTANRDPYFKHLLATATTLWEPVLVPLLHVGLQEDAAVTIATALLHDCVEMQRKYHQDIDVDDLYKLILKVPQCTEARARRIINMVLPFTPKEEGAKISNSPEGTAQWVETKLEEFIQKMAINLGADTYIFHNIKAADMIANIRETLEDIRAGRDNNMKQPLGARLYVFEMRIRKFLQTDKNSPLAPLLQEALESLEQIKLHTPTWQPS